MAFSDARVPANLTIQFLGDHGGVVSRDFRVTTTPEPDTIVMVATGALSVFGIARRRFLKAPRI